MKPKQALSAHRKHAATSSPSKGALWRWSLSQRCSTLALIPCCRGQGGNRGPGLLAGGEQFALELWGIGSCRAMT